MEREKTEDVGQGYGVSNKISTFGKSWNHLQAYRIITKDLYASSLLVLKKYTKNSHLSQNFATFVRKPKNNHTMRKLTREEFIERARAVHGDKYNYDKVVYVDNKTKVIVTCPEHGDFLQMPSSHLRGMGCPVCAITARADKLRNSATDFIRKAEEKHGVGGYDYSEVLYTNNCTKVKIRCNECGKVFFITPNSHLRGSGCPVCNRKRGEKLRTMSNDEFVTRARAVHGDKYDYGKTIYIRSIKPVIITCRVHGDFLQTPHSHLAGNGCPKCGILKVSQLEAVPESVFLEKAIAVHGDAYDYSKLNYKNITSPVNIVCRQCGKKFSQKARNHLLGHGCPVCRRSRLEMVIMTELDNRGIKYTYQYRSPFLGRQSLDFYIDDINVGIEAQGCQHYRPVSFADHMNPVVVFEENQERDRKKKRVCEENGVRLFYFTQVVGVIPDEETYTDINALMGTIEEMIATESIVFRSNVESTSQRTSCCASS